MKKYLGFSLIGIVLVGAAVFMMRSKSNQVDPHRAIESRIALNDDQRKELVDAGSDGVRVYRFQSPEGLWQVALNQTPESSTVGKSLSEVGVLFKKPLGNEVNMPVYLCAYDGFKGKNLGLDLKANCTGEGKLVQPDPVGYVSSQVRTGFFILVRCRNEKAGFYLSLNTNCEGPKDRVHGPLGVIRAAH